MNKSANKHCGCHTTYNTRNYVAKGFSETNMKDFIVSGFREDFLNIGQKLYKITHHLMGNR